MALRYKIDLPAFTGVAAGQTATIDIPSTGTYYDLGIEYRESGTLAAKADLEAALTEVRVKINGQTVRRYSAEELLDLNEYNGIAFQTGFLPIFFAEPWARNAVSEDLLAWGMNDVQTFQLEIDIDAAATAPSLKAVCVKTREARNLGAIKKVKKFNVAVAATGITNMQSLPRIDSYTALHCQSANISDVAVKVDNVEIFDLTAAQNAQSLENEPRTNPVTGWFHVDFNSTGRIEDLLPMVVTEIRNGKQVAVGRVQDFQVDFNMSSAASFNLLAETIGTV